MGHELETRPFVNIYHLWCQPPKPSGGSMDQYIASSVELPHRAAKETGAMASVSAKMALQSTQLKGSLVEVGMDLRGFLLSFPSLA